MSRIGKMPIAVPKGAEVKLAADSITVKGPLGTLTQAINPNAQIKQEGERLLISPTNDSAEANAMSGTLRALVANMVNGVTKGFERRLTLVGVGFRAQAQGSNGRREGGNAQPDGDRAERGRQAEGWSGGCQHPCLSSARALQGQGCSLLG